MSKLNVKGSASFDYPVDIFRIRITMKSADKSSGEALAAGKRKTEEFLMKMQETLGIAPNEMTWDAENTEQSYGENAAYRYMKRVSLTITAEIPLLERITTLLESLADVEYHVETDLSGVAEKECEVMKAAVADSRHKAELIAEALGQKLIGMETVNYEFSESESVMLLAKARGVEADHLACALKNPTRNISKSIDITWIAE